MDELGAGDTGPDDDEMRRQLVEVVELAPGEIRSPSGCASAGCVGGTGRDQYDVGVEHFLRAVGALGKDFVGGRPEHGIGQLLDTGDQPHASLINRALMSADRCVREVFDAFVDLRQFDDGAADVQLDSQIRGPTGIGADTGRGDERLRRHAVVKHAGPTDPVGVDDGDVRPGTRRRTGPPHAPRARLR